VRPSSLTWQRDISRNCSHDVADTARTPTRVSLRYRIRLCRRGTAGRTPTRAGVYRSTVCAASMAADAQRPTPLRLGPDMHSTGSRSPAPPAEAPDMCLQHCVLCRCCSAYWRAGRRAEGAAGSGDGHVAGWFRMAGGTEPGLDNPAQSRNLKGLHVAAGSRVTSSMPLSPHYWGTYATPEHTCSSTCCAVLALTDRHANSE
jgi:hypothetical protein